MIGEPPRNDVGQELAWKQCLLWTLAETVAKMNGCRSPFFVLEKLVNDDLWNSESWNQFRKWYRISTYLNSYGERCATTLATEFPDEPWTCTTIERKLKWTTEFKKAVVKGVMYWYRGGALCRMDGSLGELTDADLKRWAQHIKRGHIPYDKRCRTCVTTRGSGRRHVRVKAQSAYVLSLDVCGPFRVRGEDADGKGYRYAVVGAYSLPRLQEEDKKSGGEHVPDEPPPLPPPEEEPGEENEPGAVHDVPHDLPSIEELFGDEDVEVPDAEVEGRLATGAVLDFLEEEEEEEPMPPLSEKDVAEMTELDQNFREVFQQVGDLLEYDTLRYVMPMKTRRASEVNEDDGTEEENFSIAELRFGQRIVGEQLWLAMRTRPDLLYPVNYMASKVSQQPNKVAQIGRRLMSYLKETRDIKLIVYGPQYQYDDGSGEAEAQAHSTVSSASRSLGSSSNIRSRTTTESARSSLHHPQEQEARRKRYKLPVTLYGYSDASFAPFGNRSFGACVVTINDTPVAWKAGRQAFVTLSVMEAELYEAGRRACCLKA